MGLYLDQPPAWGEVMGLNGFGFLGIRLDGG
jgi:hypothetical protein